MLGLLRQPENNVVKEDIRNAFRLLAGKNAKNGEISRESLRKALQHSSGGYMEPSDIEEIMSMVDNNVRGVVNYDEIIDFVMSHYNRNRSQHK